MTVSADRTPLVLTAPPDADAAEGERLRRLLAGAAGGSAEALAGLYDALAGELYGFALWRTGSRGISPCGPHEPPYSYRSASTGSSWAAREAG